MTHHHARLIVVAIATVSFSTPIYAQQETAPQEVADLRARAEVGVAEAQYQLGQVYEGGRGIPGDLVLAVQWYRLAAEQGHTEAQFKLSFGGRQDDTQALAWMRRAAEQGDSFQQYLLGDSYADGLNVSQDDAEAVRWFRLAAAQGEWMAQQALQEMYVEGRVVPLDELEPALREFVVSESERRARERLEPIPPPPPPPPPPQ